MNYDSFDDNSNADNPIGDETFAVGWRLLNMDLGVDSVGSNNLRRYTSMDPCSDGAELVLVVD